MNVIINKKIIDEITNLKHNQNIPISNIYEYKIIKKDNSKNLHYWIIMNKETVKILIDKTNNQYFGDTTYKCIPPIFHKYKFFLYKQIF